MARSPKTSSGTLLKQAGLLRKLEYAWVGSGALATVAGTVAAMAALIGFMGTPRPGPGTDDLSPGRIGRDGDGRGAVVSPPPLTAATTFTSGEWIETFDPRAGRMRGGAVVNVQGRQAWVRFCNRVSMSDDGAEEIRPLDQLRKWDVKNDPRGGSGAKIPLTAPLTMGPEDFRPGEEVTAHDRTAFSGRGRVVGVDGTKVVVRWNDPRIADELVGADALRLVNWGPFDRLDPVPSTLVPKSIPKAASAQQGSYSVGQKVEVVFRGEWVPSEVIAVTGSHTYAVSVAMALNGSILAKSAQMRPAGIAAANAGAPIGGNSERSAAEKTRAGMTFMPSQFYRAEDEAEAMFGTKWEAVRVKRVEGMKIYIYPREADGAEEWRTYSQMRVLRDLAQKRMEEGMVSMRAKAGSASTLPAPPTGSSPSPASVRSSGRGDALTALDCRPGMAVTVRQVGSVNMSGRVSRVEGDQVYVVLSNSGGGEVARTADQLSTSRAESAKAAAEYKPGERVYVRWSDSNAWWTNRVEKIEGDRIILVRGQVSDSSEVLRTRTAEDVRSMRMVDEKAAR